jgi:hypothetical protein
MKYKGIDLYNFETKRVASQPKLEKKKKKWIPKAQW